MIAAWHFFVFVWTHHHHLADLIGWLRHEYPGMPSSWYRTYALDLERTYGTGPDLLLAVRPY